MKTHSIFKDKSLIKQGVETKDLYNYIPAGARFVSGNSVKIERDPATGAEVEVTEIKATYRVREGGTITILQDK